MKVPKIIHQLWIGEKPSPINAMNSVKDMNPDFEYMFWNEKTIEEKLDIPARYQRKIDEHETLNGKADIIRWFILEKYGGVFVDADIISIEPLDDFLLTKGFFSWENEIARKNLCATTLMGFCPNHIIPQKAIKWILENETSYEKTNLPSWRTVGPELLSKIYHTLPNKDIVNVFPHYYFLPDHHSGSKYYGHGKVYMIHEWGSTHNNYNKINEMNIPHHHTTPNNSIDIHIPKTTINKQLKDVMKSIKNMEGHFNINIHYENDLSKYIKSMRNVKQVEQKLKLLNEYNRPVNLNMEHIEQALVKHYIKENDKVLELGARYGAVSITTNKILKDKKSHYVVEPDKKVWKCLENNMKENKTNFNIIKGIIGKHKYKINGDGYATHTIKSDDGDIDCYPLPNIDFNVLIADCEGYLETFFDENKKLFESLELVIFETDRPEVCNYNKIIKELIEMGYHCLQQIPEPNMPNMFHFVFGKDKIRIFDTRNEMICHFAEKIKKPKICELGVFKGEFLEFIKDNIDFDILDGVDLFEGNLYSGDVDGNNPVYCQLEKQYIYLNNKYKKFTNINLYKTYTQKYLSQIEDNKYDIIYIDADHSYEGVKRDIILSYSKIKNGGYIMGHDYEMNMNKAHQYYHFGTKRAVDEFCSEYNQKIIAKGNDGCVSFCIQINKI